MSIELLFLVLIPILFSIIHLIEFSSYLFRVAGLQVDAKVTGYSIQQIAFVGTRFFFVAMMPMIGFIVDRKIGQKSYLLMIHCSLLGAVILNFWVLANINGIIARFSNIVREYANGASIVSALLKIFKSPNKIARSNVEWKELARYFKGSSLQRTIAWQAAIVFACYATAVFLSFYTALQFFEYRSSIGQMSGVINGLATIILSFSIEPNLSRSIDSKSEDSYFIVYSMMIGRLIGTGVIGQLVVALMWFFVK